MDIINEVIMREMFDAEWVYESPEVLVIELKSEGVLCFSNEIPDWEENAEKTYGMTNAPNNPRYGMFLSLIPNEDEAD